MAINPKYEARFSTDPDVIELGRIERRIQQLAHQGDLFETESLEEEDSKLADPKIQKLLDRRDELIESCRPQCVDADNEIFAAEVGKIAKEEFGLEDDEAWEKVNE